MKTDKEIENLAGKLSYENSQIRMCQAYGKVYPKTMLLHWWQVVRDMDLDELSYSELYAMVHTSHDFYNKLSKYYQNRK